MSIEVSNLFKYYGEQAALLDVSFPSLVDKSQVFWGQMALEKSTTMKILTGYTSSSNGLVNVCDQEVDTRIWIFEKK